MPLPRLRLRRRSSQPTQYVPVFKPLVSRHFNLSPSDPLTSVLIAMHNRTKHTKEKPLKCDFPGCNARFAESSNLSKHKKIHLPEAQCTCQICFKSFSRDDQLKRHLKTHARKHTGRGASVGSISQVGEFDLGNISMEVDGR
jgi:uncharacterized Zn-finger protein